MADDADEYDEDVDDVDDDDDSGSDGGHGDSDDDSSGSNGDKDNSNFQQYVLDVVHGQQVVLLFNDSKGHAETSPLITVGGDAGSSKMCLKSFGGMTAKMTTMASSTGIISKYGFLYRLPFLILLTGLF